MSEQDEIPLFEIDWDRPEITNVVDSVSRGGYWAKGPYVDEFEAAIEAYLDVEHAIAVNSGTTALEVALRAVDVGPGDEVIVPSFTFIATANAVKLVGAEPVFVDVERETFGLDPDSVRAAISDNTSAILPIHCYGRACDISSLAEIADEHDLALVEDAAEAFGARVDGDPVGTHGDVTALSFCQNKVVATGEGGAVVTDDEDLAQSVERYRSHGRASTDYFESSGSGHYVSLGTNYRMPDVVAAIGAGQMERVEEIVSRRREAALSLTDLLRDIEGVQPPEDVDGGRHVFQIYTIVCEDEATREAVKESLATATISSKIYWDPPVHRTKFYDRGNRRDLPTTDDLSSRVLSLPMHPNLSPDEVARIAEAVQEGAQEVSSGAAR